MAMMDNEIESIFGDNTDPELEIDYKNYLSKIKENSLKKLQEDTKKTKTMYGTMRGKE